MGQPHQRDRTMSEIEQHKAELNKQSLEAMQKPYCPYSHYKVGAALLLKNKATGEIKIIQGCNVENASYPCGACAEATAVGNAVASGMQDWEFLAVSVATKDGGSPCGRCRQILNEFNPQMIVIELKGDGTVHNQFNLSQLLVDSFGPKNLQ